MSDDSPTTPVLEYHSPERNSKARLRRIIQRMPRWVVALCMVVPLFVIDKQFFVFYLPASLFMPARYLLAILWWFTLFSPGAVWRLRLSRMAIAFGIACGWWAIAAFVSFPPLGLPHLYPSVFLLMAGAVLVGLNEWRHGGRMRDELLTYLVVNVAVVLSLQLALAVIQYHTAPFEMPFTRLRWVTVSWTYLLSEPLCTLVIWLAICAIPWLAAADAMYRRRVAFGVAALALLIFITFFHDIRYRVASASLLNDGFFTPRASAQILGERGNVNDQRLLWIALEHGRPWRTLGNGVESEDESEFDEACVKSLAALDARSTAERLSKIVRERGDESLLLVSADLFADEERREMIPMLTKYALQGKYECQKALQQLGAWPPAGPATTASGP